MKTKAMMVAAIVLGLVAGTAWATPPYDVDGDGDVDFDDVQMAGTDIVVNGNGGAGVGTYDFDGDGDSDRSDVFYMIDDALGLLVGDIHPAYTGGSEAPSDVDNADIGRAAGHWNTPVGTGQVYLDGDRTSTATWTVPISSLLPAISPVRCPAGLPVGRPATRPMAPTTPT